MLKKEFKEKKQNSVNEMFKKRPDSAAEQTHTDLINLQIQSQTIMPCLLLSLLL